MLVVATLSMFFIVKLMIMKISICITYYNQEKFVRQSLDSVLAIDYPCDFEILCGDDGSDDNMIDIIKEYAEKYPDNIFLHPKKYGVH